MTTNGLTAFELASFARTLEQFNEDGLQVDGEVWLDGIGHMTVTFDGQSNLATQLEGVE